MKILVAACVGVLALGCGSSGSGAAGPDGGQSASGSSTGSAASGAASSGGAASGTASGSGVPSQSGSASGATGGGSGTGSGASSGSSSGTPSSGAADAGAVSSDGGFPSGWLYTSGGQIYVSQGGSTAKPWMGRGVNIDDIFFCGYDNTLWMTNPDKTLETEISGLMSAWKPTFVRISLGMDSYPTVTSWLTNASQYKTPMTGVIQALGANANVYVLVTLRSDASMIGEDGSSEATFLPSDSTSTPDKTKYPTGTDAVYTALVDSFANDAFVLFGLSNEPGGNTLSSAKIAAAMTHAVGTIRAEEDKLGVPHHLVSVQGNNWTSDISFYAKTPIAFDNVVYEVHGYPPPTSGYTYPNIPVILGEYGMLPSGGESAFYADVESKGIPNLAWDFDPYSDCSPDLLNVTTDASKLQPTAWGMTVQSYLTSHAQ